MHIAKQGEIDKFMDMAIVDPEIYPYLSVSKFIDKTEETKDDWQRLILISDTGNTLLKITMNRQCDMDWNIALYSKNEHGSGMAVETVKQLIQRYKPRGLTSCVHASNHRSLALHYKIFGTPWGIEPSSAWNSLLGEYEDLHWFRMLL